MGVILIQFLQPLADMMGEAIITIEIQGRTTLMEIIEAIIQTKSRTIQEIFFNEHKEWVPKVTIFINGKVMRSSKQEVNSGDHILVLPPICGG